MILYLTINRRDDLENFMLTHCILNELKENMTRNVILKFLKYEKLSVIANVCTHNLAENVNYEHIKKLSEMKTVEFANSIDLA